jgi:thiamine kinase-like enzyme
VSALFDKLLLYYKKNDVTPLSPNEYQSILLDQIHDNSYLLSQATRQKLAQTLSILGENLTNDLRDETLLVQGHGDFWLGNILLDENGQRLLIIDWERSNQYSLMYDLLTLFAIYSTEKGNFKLLKNVLESGADYAPVMDILRKYQEQFSSSCDRSSLKRQFKIFLLERISFSLSLHVTTPFIDHRAQEEFDKWHAFVVAILKEGILTDPTQ